jgi:glycerophosphoryl diester phosphodiesterase
VNNAPAIIAHRGSSFAHHENTMAAFERAVADQADGIEFDVRFTADKQWIVHHDPAILVGGEPLQIADMNSDDIAKLSVGPAAAPIPALGEFLDWAKAAGVSLIFDIKDRAGVRELIATTEAARLPVPPVFSSFHKSVVRELRSLRPAWRSALIVGNPRWRFMRRLLSREVLRWARAHHLYGLSLHERWVAPSLVHRAQSEGINIAVWTVDDPARMAMLALLGVDAIITNRPDLGRETMEHLSARQA